MIFLIIILCLHVVYTTNGLFYFVTKSTKIPNRRYFGRKQIFRYSLTTSITHEPVVATVDRSLKRKTFGAEEANQSQAFVQS